MVTSCDSQGEGRLERWISYILICGVLTSLMLEVVGVLLFYRTVHSLDLSRDRSMFIHGRDFFTFVAGLIRGSLPGLAGLRLMVLGIVVLILTPYLRAVMSVVYFASRRDVKYLVITLFVLIILTLSLAAH